MVPVDAYFGFDILNKYKSPSNIYGFILYTNLHPYVKKVLRDSDFWQEFDEKYGKTWPIFAVKALEPKCEKIIGGDCGDGYVGMMIKLSEETQYNKNAIEFFHLSDSEKDLPCFVVFANDSKKDKILQRTYKIKGKTTDEVHNSILSVIESVAEMEKCILDNNSIEKLHETYVFDEVNNTLDQLEFKEYVRNNLPIAGSIASFVGVIIKLLSSVK